MRLGVSSYLSARPLAYGLEQDPDVDLVISSPARLADLLRLGLLDAALTSSSEYFNGDYRIIPGAAISACSKGADTLLLSKLPWTHLRAVALDSASRSTNLLLRLMMHWSRPGAAVAYAIRPGDALRALTEFDACLLIGDAAFYRCCETKYEYDMAHMWRERTGLPMVLTVWLARPGVGSDVARAVAQAAKRGLAALEAITQEAAPRLNVDAEQLFLYLTKSLDYTWSDRHDRALYQFGQALYSLGLVQHDRIPVYLE